MKFTKKQVVFYVRFFLASIILTVLCCHFLIFNKSDAQAQGFCLDIYPLGDILSVTPKQTVRYPVELECRDSDGNLVNDKCCEPSGVFSCLGICGLSGCSWVVITPTTQNLGSIYDRECFLTTIRFRNVEEDKDYGSCKIYQNNNMWVLEATASQSNDTVTCQAQCLTW